MSEPLLSKPLDSPARKRPAKQPRAGALLYESQEVFSQQPGSPPPEPASAKRARAGQPPSEQQEEDMQKIIAEQLQLIPESHFFSEHVGQSKASDSQTPSHIDNVVKRKLKKLQIKEVFTNLYFD